MLNKPDGRIEPIFGCSLTGILRALSGTKNILPIVHGPMNCSSGHRSIPLQAGLEPIIPTTSLVDINIARGTDRLLEESIRKYYELYKPQIIVVILTCATSLVSEYLDGTIAKLSDELKIKIIELDGSASAGDEVDGFKYLYLGLKDLIKENNDDEYSRNKICIHGFSASDYAINVEVNQLKAILEKGFNKKVEEVLFLDFDPSTSENLFNMMTIFCGWLWTSGEEWIPAPFGIEGTKQFLNQWSRLSGIQINNQFLRDIEKIAFDFKQLQDLIRNDYSSLSPRVAIEGLGWWVIGLGRFLKQELGCTVMISSDSSVMEYQNRYGQVADFTLIDVGNYELLTHLDSFQPHVVFGSSYVKKGPWLWVPFFQPIWHDIEENRGSLLGLDGASRIGNIILSGGKIFA